MNCDIIITTIAEKPTFVMEVWAHVAELLGGRLIMIGDTKTGDLRSKVWHFYGVQYQEHAFLDLHTALPMGHYSRKNFGYILSDADWLFETDDDNVPEDVDAFVQWVKEVMNTDGQVEHPTCMTSDWCNLYALFGASHLRPRGYPEMYAAQVEHRYLDKHVARVRNLVPHHDPDVDASTRLLLKDQSHWTWPSGLQAVLATGTRCTWNSQCTLWPTAYKHLMYMPAYVGKRKGDILRSMLVLPRLWELGDTVCFETSPAIMQHRNTHDLIADLLDELPMYNVMQHVHSWQDAADHGIIYNLPNEYAALRAYWRAIQAS